MNNLFKYTKYPNPLFRRENFIILDGMWDFEITNSEGIPFYTKNIIVPFSYETKASGINDQTQYDTIWYRRKVKLNKNKKYNLCFLGVDYNCYVFVNNAQLYTKVPQQFPYPWSITALQTPKTLLKMGTQVWLP